jgi:hypothetical protein
MFDALAGIAHEVGWTLERRKFKVALSCLRADFCYSRAHVSGG